MTANEAACEIRDEGPVFDPSTLPDPTDPEAIMRAHGRGLLLIRSFMDEVRFNDSGNQITMIKRRAPSMSTPTIEHRPSSSTSHLIPLRYSEQDSEHDGSMSGQGATRAAGQ